MCRMQMHHRARRAAGLVQRRVQRHFLGRGTAGSEFSGGVEPRQPGRVEKAERGIGWRHHIAAVVQPHADIARRARRQPALEQRAAEPTDFLAYPGFSHIGILAASPFLAFSHALAARPSRDTQRAKPYPNSGAEEPQRKCCMPEAVIAKPRIAVIGLGSMGFGMATSLRRAGFEVTGCDVSAEAVARFVADGGNGARTPAEAAKAADIVVSVVVNAAQTETILFGT